MRSIHCRGTHEGMEVITKEEAKARGLKRFFTGRPCNRGHLSERYVKGTAVCVECAKEWHRRRYDSVREVHNAAQRARYYSDLERSRAASNDKQKRRRLTLRALQLENEMLKETIRNLLRTGGANPGEHDDRHADGAE